MKSMKKHIVFLLTTAMIFSTAFSFPTLTLADDLTENEIASEAYTLNITVLPAAEEIEETTETYTAYSSQETVQQSYQESAQESSQNSNQESYQESASQTQSTPASNDTPTENSNTSSDTTAAQENASNDSSNTQSSAPASAGGPSSESDASATDVGPHTHDYWIVESTATCISSGYYTAECTICGDRFTKFVDSLSDGAHAYENLGGDMCNYNFCTNCGHVDVSAGIDQWTASYNTMYFTNSYRTAIGLPELTMSSYLNSLAQQRAAEIASDFSHGGFRGCNGENIAKGYFNTWDVVGAWSASPGHYENMVRDWFTEYGFGYYIDGSGQIYCVQLFN